jgi:3'(2'), 5'-bisphosphate nucleotidase
VSLDTLEILIRVAAEAAQVVCEVYETPFQVDYKTPEDPVTEADRRANALICKELARYFPDVPIVAEESDEQSFAGFRNAERIFFVDPVDGTREFVDRNGEFVVMIGLVDGERATLGVVHAPATGEAWAGSTGHGAWHIARDGNRTPIRVSAETSLSSARVVSSRSHKSARLERALQLLAPRELASIGSAGLKAADVAMGRSDVYISPGFAGKRWDACAPDAIVTSAGGKYTDQTGSPIDYRSESLANEDGLVATNGLLHPAVIERLAHPSLNLRF